MATRTNLDFLIKQLENDELPLWWRVMDGKSLISEYNEEIPDKKVSIDRLQNLVKNLSGSTIEIAFPKVHPSKNGGNTKSFEFRIDLLEDSNKKIQENPRFTDSDGWKKYYELKAQQEAEKSSAVLEKLLSKIESLEARLNEEEDEDDEEDEEMEESGISGLLKPYLPGIMDRFGIKATNEQKKEPGINGMNTTEQSASKENNSNQANEDAVKIQMNKAGQAAMRLLKLDGEAGTHLLLLAEMAEKDIEKYKFALSFLKG